MEKKYISIVTPREARPRSKRLRELGIAESSGISNTNVQAGGGSSSPDSWGDGHIHPNKSVLDEITTDEERYIYLTKLEENADGTEYDSVERKAKVGYADEARHAKEAEYAKEAEHAAMAHDLDANSPVYDKVLSKIKPDETKHLVKLLGGLISDNIQSQNFLSGALGSGYTIQLDSETGKSYLEVDELFVRIKAMFTELEIKKLSYTGGNYMFSAAGMKCAKLEEHETFWRCYLMVDNGETAVENPFKEGDQVRSQEFNIKPKVYDNVSNRYYWRLCVNIGNDYIDLSKTDCDSNSDIPQVGDSLVQLGNRTDKSRQNAIVLSVYGEDAPSIHQYVGISSYSMAGKDVTVISPKGNKFLGDFVSASTGENYDDKFSEMQATIDTVKKQTDKEYTLWFFDYAPTLDNIPASEWKTDELKVSHEEDIFYNRLTGFGYRFEKSSDTWEWNSIVDQQTIKALENAAKAQDTADHKRRVFVSQPTDAQAYDVGDLWTNATIGEYINDQLVCITAKVIGAAFNISHWKPSSNITTAYIKNLGDEILLTVGQNKDDAEKLISAAQGAAAAAQLLADSANVLAGTADRTANSAQAQSGTNATAIQQTKDDISIVAGRFNKDGTLKDTSGLVTTAQGSTLYAAKSLENGDNIIGYINQTATTTTISASKIDITGAVTFNSFNSDLKGTINGKATTEQVGTAKNEAINEAQLKVNALSDTLGGLAYKDAVEKAMMGSTLISGAYIKTELIDVDNLYVKHLRGATGDFTGTLTGVRGTFSFLSSPGGETTMTFEEAYSGMLITGDIHHHEIVNFYGSAMFATKSFGFNALAYVKVTGNKAEYYRFGTYSRSPERTLTLQGVTIGPYTWYKIPLAPSGRYYDDCYNMVFLCNSSGNRYLFDDALPGNVFYVFNTNNAISNIYYDNSGAVNISGGQVHTLMKAPREYLTPAVGAVYGAGLIRVSTFDNNW